MSAKRARLSTEGRLVFSEYLYLRNAPRAALWRGSPAPPRGAQGYSFPFAPPALPAFLLGATAPPALPAFLFGATAPPALPVFLLVITKVIIIFRSSVLTT